MLKGKYRHFGPPPMEVPCRTEEEFEEVRAHNSDEKIEAALTARLIISDAAIAAHAHLLARQRERERQKDENAREAAARATAAAELSARAAERSARWTMLAALFTLIGSFVGAVISMGSAKGWF